MNSFDRYNIISLTLATIIKAILSWKGGYKSSDRKYEFYNGTKLLFYVRKTVTLSWLKIQEMGLNSEK